MESKTPNSFAWTFAINKPLEGELRTIDHHSSKMSLTIHAHSQVRLLARSFVVEYRTIPTAVTSLFMQKG
jgi:hypothetical protein